jgi:hypothetical protein
MEVNSFTLSDVPNGFSLVDSEKIVKIANINPSPGEDANEPHNDEVEGSII